MSAQDTEQHLPAIERVAVALDHALPAETAQRLAQYLAQVATWNRKINLTAAREAAALAEVMLADAFVLSRAECVPAGARILDVGTGAGAPLVPLLVLRPDLTALCIEPLQKRATFLRMLSVRLGLLGRMRVQQARFDLERPAVAEVFDLATSRATFAPELWLHAGLAVAERAIVMTAGAEVAPAPAAAARPPAILEASVNYVLPFSQAPRRLSLYRRG